MMTSSNHTFLFSGLHVRLRTRWSLPVLAMGLSAVALSCSSDSKGTRKNLCEASQIEGCNAACSEQSPCNAGLYCEDGKCSAQCRPASVAVDCGSNATCSDDGHCVDSNGGMDGGPGGGDGEGHGDGDGTGGNVDGSVCGSLDLKPTPKIPNVMFIIDQSGSMNAKDFDNGTVTRWDAIKRALLGSDMPKVEGLLQQINDSVNFGVVLYTAVDQATCPLLTTVEIAMHNYDAVKAVYAPAPYKKETPTGDSIDAVVKSPEIQALIQKKEPPIFVLATDGEPDRCEELNPQHGQQESIDAVTRAHDQDGIDTYIIAVAAEDEISQDHVQAVANAGKGVKPGDPDAPTFRVTTVDALKNTLTGIVSGALSCTVPLKGKVTTSSPCDDGTVALDGMTLKCDDANGWSLSGDSAIEIKGTACDKLKAGGTLSADFKCGSAIPL